MRSRGSTLPGPPNGARSRVSARRASFSARPCRRPRGGEIRQTPLAEFASADDGPNGFDDSVADGVELLVKVDGSVGVADDEFDLVADVGSVGGVLHFDGGVLGGQAYAADGGGQYRLGDGAVAAHGLLARVAD